MIEVHKFKRSFSNYVVDTLLILAAIIFVRDLWVAIELQNTNCYQWTSKLTEIIVYMGIGIVLPLISIILTDVILPPDFEYLIKVNEEYIIFEMSEEDHRRINKNFNIAIQKRRYMVLDDGISRIKIAYNKEALQFLKSIKKYLQTA